MIVKTITKGLMVLSMLICMSSTLLASDCVSAHTSSDRDVSKFCGSCHKPKKERTCAPTPISHPTTIKHSGCYCLTRDIQGTIVIDADDVTLDLNCHEIDAEGSPSALISIGRTNITVKNGGVVNSSDFGAQFTSCTDLTVEDVLFLDYAREALQIEAQSVNPPSFIPVLPSQAVTVSGCTFTKGNRALVVRGCNQVQVNDCQVFENVDTIKSVVGIEFCTDVIFDGVHIDRNTKDVRLLSANLTGSIADGSTSFTGSISGTVLTVTSVPAPNPIRLGMAITGTGIPAGAVISDWGFGPGAGIGGTGTYRVNFFTPAPIAATSITGTCGVLIVSAVGQANAIVLGQYVEGVPSGVTPNTLITAFGPTATFTGSISGDTLTVAGLTGTLNPGDLVLGDGVSPGTVIISVTVPGTTYKVNFSQVVASTPMLGSGQKGNTGTYTVNFPQTVASQAMITNGQGNALASRPFGLQAFGPELAVLLIEASKNVQILNSSTNFNSGTQNTIAALVTGLAFSPFTPGFFLNLSNNITFKNHQANSNTAKYGRLGGIRQLNSMISAFKNCQTNSNVMTNGNSGGDYGVVGFGTQAFCLGLSSIASSRIYIKESQSNSNNNIGGEVFGFIASAFFGNERDYVVEDSVANDNGDLNLSSHCFGFNAPFGNFAIPLPRGKNVVYKNCQANGTKGYSNAFGFASIWDDTTIENCQSNGTAAINLIPNLGNGFYAGSYGIATTIAKNIRVKNCQVSNVNCAHFTAFGIANRVPPFILNGPSPFSGSNEVTIQNCEVSDTMCPNGLAAGISSHLSRNTVVKDCEVYGSTGTTGHGILFNSCTDSKAIGSEMLDNKNSGIELVGSYTTVAIIECIAMGNDIGFDFNATSTVSCCLVQDSRALSNKSKGFVYVPASFSTTFIGNEAQCNGTSTADDYENLVGKISLQELHWADGSFTNLSGDANTEPWTNFIAGN